MCTLNIPSLVSQDSSHQTSLGNHIVLAAKRNSLVCFLLTLHPFCVKAKKNIAQEFYCKAYILKMLIWQPFLLYISQRSYIFQAFEIASFVQPSALPPSMDFATPMLSAQHGRVPICKGHMTLLKTVVPKSFFGLFQQKWLPMITFRIIFPKGIISLLFVMTWALPSLLDLVS